MSLLIVAVIAVSASAGGDAVEVGLQIHCPYCLSVISESMDGLPTGWIHTANLLSLKILLEVSGEVNTLNAASLV